MAGITQDGVLTALKAGRTTITAIAYNDASGIMDVTILAAPTSVGLNVESAAIVKGMNMTLQPVFNEFEGGDCSFRSDDESIATVSDGGVVTGVAGGVTRIWVETYNGKEAYCDLTINQLFLNAERTKLGVGEVLNISTTHVPASDTAVSYKSSKSGVIKLVEEEGIRQIKAVAAGSATITATAADGSKATLKFTVLAKPKSVIVKASRKRIGLGEKLQLSATFSSKSAGAVTYSIIDPVDCDFATVDENTGLLSTFGTTETEKTVTVQARSYNDKVGKITITLTPAPEELALNAEACTLCVDDSFALQPVITEGTTSAFEYAVTSGAEYVSVDANGVIRATAADGEAVVLVRTYNGLEKQVTVQTAKAPSNIVLQAPYKVMAAKDKLTLELVTGTAPCRVSWTSSNKAVAKVSDGVVTAVKAGTATITAKTYNNKKATIKLTVKAKPKTISISGRTELGLGETLRPLLKGNTGAYMYATDINVLNDDTSKPAIGIEDGCIVAKNVGTARLMACAGSLQTRWTTITVKKAPGKDDMGIALQHECGGSGWYQPLWGGYDDVLYVAKGDYANIRLEMDEDCAGGYTARSTDPAVLKYDSGRVSFMGTGDAEIVFTAYNGTQVSIPFSVKAAPTSLYISAGNVVNQFSEDLRIGTDSDFDWEYDFMHMTLGTSSKSILKPVTYYDNEGYGCDWGYTGVKSGSATISVKLFNGLTKKKTVSVLKNKLDGITPKLTASDIQRTYGYTFDIQLKSIEFLSPTKIKCEFYFINGMTYRQINYIDELDEISVRYEYDDIAVKTMKKCKISLNSKPYTSKVFTVTFSGKDVLGDFEFQDIRNLPKSKFDMNFDWCHYIYTLR